MSQDIRRDRELGREELSPGVRDIVTTIESERWRNIAYNENERAGRIQQQLHAANAKLAEANDALDQARRDATSDPRVQRVIDWLDRKEAAIRDRVNFAIGPADGFPDLGAIESRAAKLRHAQYDSKIVQEVRNLLAPSVWRDTADGEAALADWERELLTKAGQPLPTRYWHLDNGYAPAGGDETGEHCRVEAGGQPEFWYYGAGEWWESGRFGDAADLAKDSRTREVTAAELPEGVTP